MQTNLTDAQKACNYDTMRHIERVRNLLNVFAREMLDRGEVHDQSKLESPEVEMFAKAVPIADLTYESAEYQDSKNFLRTALAHHYAKDRHHPEHHKKGVDDMTLCDIVEMLADWKAASERHNDGNILKSIETNADRFGLSPQLVRILENTAKTMFGVG